MTAVSCRLDHMDIGDQTVLDPPSEPGIDRECVVGFLGQLFADTPERFSGEEAFHESILERVQDFTADLITATANQDSLGLVDHNRGELFGLVPSEPEIQHRPA
jgi:hypothetical protein